MLSLFPRTALSSALSSLLDQWLDIRFQFDRQRIHSDNQRQHLIDFDAAVNFRLTRWWFYGYIEDFLVIYLKPSVIYPEGVFIGNRVKMSRWPLKETTRSGIHRRWRSKWPIFVSLAIRTPTTSTEFQVEMLRVLLLHRSCLKSINAAV